MRKKVNINIGEYHASMAQIVIHTILGSCVAVCLYDRNKHLGGMNHILLPGKPNMDEFNTSARYGINAMELLINRIMRLGGDRRCLDAKVFGGAHIITAISEENGMGKKNSDFAIEFLENEKIKIVSMDIGGTQTRKVFFHTDTGEVFLKYIPSLFQKYFSKKEEHKLRRVKSDLNKAGGVTLFED
jgi:chemotaxis protein CheD